jgi:hypothetical protein
MANILSKSGISSGSVVQTWHVTQSVDAFTGTQAYDITLSGSLTITGSVFLDTAINKNFFGTSSYSVTSSQTTLSTTAQSAITTSYADNESSIFQLYHDQINVISGSTFYVGVGPVTDTSSSVGFSFPYNSGRIVSASLSSAVLGTTASLSSSVQLFKNSTKIHDFTSTLNYNNRLNRIVNGLDIASTASLGDVIYAKFLVASGSTATNVIHNINLFIKRNG